jgi:hypothetical protein
MEDIGITKEINERSVFVCCEPNATDGLTKEYREISWF